MMDRRWVSARLNRTCAQGGEGAERGERGDHDLNPGFRPDGPLRAAAVLVGLVERPAGLSVLLTRRTDTLEHHPGQISFPGGHMEPGDADAVSTALRETEEEIGLSASHIDVLGHLDTYITRTGFSISPIIGLVRPPFELSLDPVEVAEAFEVPLAFFLDPANHHRRERDFEGTKRTFYAMPFEAYYIWGATAGMLINLYQTLVDAPDAN